MALRGSGDALTGAFHAACSKALRSAAPTTTLLMPWAKRRSLSLIRHFADRSCGKLMGESKATS
jgi:hypothetical protein